MGLSRRDLVGSAIVALTVLASVVAYPELPARLAIHFDASGQPDDFAAKLLDWPSCPCWLWACSSSSECSR